MIGMHSKIKIELEPEFKIMPYLEDGTIRIYGDEKYGAFEDYESDPISISNIITQGIKEIDLEDEVDIDWIDEVVSNLLSLKSKVRKEKGNK